MRQLDRAHAVTVAAAVLVGVFAVIAVRNAFTYPPIGGYDAAEHIAYARSLIEQGEIPHRTGTYYTPPLWYALAGTAMKLGDRLGLDDPVHLGQLLNALFVTLTAVLVWLLARLLFPRRPLLALAALAFFVACPLTLRMATMFHPQALVLLLSTAGLLVVARMVTRRSYGLAAAAAAGVLLGGAELVRSVGIWSYGVGAIVLLAAAVLDRERRRRAAAALAVVLALGVLVPLPWYAYLQHTYGYAVFGRPATGDVPTQPEPVPLPVPQQPPAAAPAPPPPAPIWFYVGTGLPDVITHPNRDQLPRDFFPIAYADTWGDVFGSWAWGATRDALPDAEPRLVAQSLLGLPLTFLAVAGWLGAAAVVLRRPRERLELLLVVGMPAAALAGMLYYGARSYEAEVDFVKGMFALPAVPFWAVSFGFALDAVWHRAPRALALVTAFLCGGALLACLEFGVV
jgi:4-amino-4-deoxy-L-arabinose transferase-like glycosyltransferase